MRVAVAGGTGLVGGHVSRELKARGHEIVVLARSAGVDLLVGEGLDASLAGVDVLVDVTDVKTLRKAKAVKFFGTITGNLLAAEERAGVAHHVALSIVGIERVHSGYYAGKLRQEEAIETASVPWTLMRATQFHEFVAELLARGTLGPIAMIPRMRSQPIAAREVAVALVDAALAQPAGMLPELAGPLVEDIPDLVRRLVAARGTGPRVLGVRLPGASGRAAAGGGLLPLSDGPRGAMTFQEWLHGDDGRACL